MCMVDFGCYTNHSLGMSVAADYNNSHHEKGRQYTFICDRYSIAAFPELSSLSGGIRNHLRCGLEIDILHRNQVIPIKCIAVSDKGIENLYRLVGRADGKPLCIEALSSIRDGVLVGLSDGFEMSEICELADFWYITPSVSETEGMRFYDAAKRSGKALCVATNACYVNESDEPIYRALQQSEDLGCFKNRGVWKHMMSEEEMFRCFAFLGNRAAREILIDNPFKLLEPYQDYLCREPYPVLFHGKEYSFPIANAVETVRKQAAEKMEQSAYHGNAAAEKRLDEELDNMKAYQAERIIISSQISEYLKKKGYRPLNKGWAGASFAAYLLRATNVDPIKHHIPWEMYFSAPDPKAYSICHYLPEAMKSERKELLERLVPGSFILPCRYEYDIPFPAKAALGAELNDALYPLTMPPLTHGLFTSQEEWIVFPADFDQDLAKGISTLSPRLLSGHFPIVELCIDKRIDKIRQDLSDKKVLLQESRVSDEQITETGKRLSQYGGGGSGREFKTVFSEDLYYLLLQNGVSQKDAVRLANHLRKGLYSAEKYRMYVEGLSQRLVCILNKAGFSEQCIAEEITKIKWLCPKSAAVEEAELALLIESISKNAN